MVKDPPANAGDARNSGLILWVRKIPWRWKWQPTLVFLPGKLHGQRSLEGFNPWDRKRVGHNLASKQIPIMNMFFKGLKEK